MSDKYCFTNVLFKKFPLIEEKTIQTLITNGYTNKEMLLFFDLDIDLPEIPDISMAQKSLLRLILFEFQESQKNLRQSFMKKLTEELGDIESNADENQIQNLVKEVAENDEQSPVPKSLTSIHCKPVVIIDRLSTIPELPSISSTSDGYPNPSTSRQTMSSFPGIPMSVKSGVSTSMTNPHSDLNIKSNIDIKVENIEEEAQTTDPITIVELSSDDSDDSSSGQQIVVPKPTKPEKTVCRRKRNGKNQYRCDQCNGQFAYPSLLVMHKRVHSRDRPYRCKYCNKKFKTAGSLKTHKRIHTEEKPYECLEPDCNKTFRTAAALVVHNRIHTGEKPYNCDVCGQRFRQSSNLNYHQMLCS